MSVVLAYADNKTAIIASDGRVSDILGNVLSEEYPKVRKIGMNVIIGYAGHAIPCNNIVDLVLDPQKTNLTQGARVEDVSICIKNQLSLYPSELKIGFIICGIGINGKMCAEIVTSGQYSNTYHPDGENPFFCGMYPKEISKEKHIFENQLLSKNPEDAMRETIKICSELSPTVNQNVFLERFQISPLKY